MSGTFDALADPGAASQAMLDARGFRRRTMRLTQGANMIQGSCHCGSVTWKFTGMSESACPTCGCIAFWRGLASDERGRRRIAVNLRLTEPQPIAKLPIDHFDGLDAFDDLPRDGRRVGDLWL
jgi:hypothetical protein